MKTALGRMTMPMHSFILQAQGEAPGHSRGQVGHNPCLSYPSRKKQKVGQSVVSIVVSALMEEVQAARTPSEAAVAPDWGDNNPARETSLLAHCLESRVLRTAAPLLRAVSRPHPSLPWLGWTRPNSVHVSPASSTQEMNQAL